METTKIYISFGMLGDAEETTDIEKFCELLSDATGYDIVPSANASQLNAKNCHLVDDLIPQSVWNSALDAARIG